MRGKFRTRSKTLPYVHAGHGSPEDLGMLSKQQRPGLHPVYDKCPEENRRCHGSGNPEGEQGDESGACGRVVGRFRTGHPVNGSPAEILGMPGEFLLDGIREEGRHDGPAARKQVPSRNPRKVPLAMGMADCRQSLLLGRRFVIFVLTMCLSSPSFSTLRRTSEIPKSPIITGTRSRPPSN